MPKGSRGAARLDNHQWATEQAQTYSLVNKQRVSCVLIKNHKWPTTPECLNGNNFTNNITII